MKSLSQKEEELFGLHPSHHHKLRITIPIVVLLMLGLVVSKVLAPIYQVPGIIGYLPVHTLLETISIVIAMLVFAVGWNAYRRGLSSNISLLAYAFFAVGVLDFTHMLSYKGMPDFVTPSSAEKAIDFWLAARTLAAIVLLTVAIRPWRPYTSTVSRYLNFGFTLILIVFLHWLLIFHDDLTPHTFIIGQGLTPFKIDYEYALVIVNLITAFMLWIRMYKPQPFNAAGLFGVACTMALSELFFTFYADVTDIYNLLGHIYKAISYFFLYRAIFVTTIEHPYNQLNASQNLLMTIINTAPMRVFWKDRDLRYLGCNNAFAKDAGLTSPQDIVGKDDYQLGWAAQAEGYRADDNAVMESGIAKLSYDESQTTPDNQLIWLRTSKVPLISNDNESLGVLGIYEDITDRKNAEQRILRLSNLYQALSEINQAIVRMDNELNLFPLVCSCAVKYGGMEMAWIGQLDESKTLILPVASYGNGLAYLDNVEISASPDVPEGRGPTGIAFRENHSVIVNNFQESDLTCPWHAQAKRFGWASSATFPITRNGKSFAVFSVYSAHKDAFDIETIDLLNETASDVSFALDNFDRETQRQLAQDKLQQAQTALKESHDRYRDLYEFAPIGYLSLDLNGIITEINWKATAMFGLKRNQLIQNRLGQFVDEKDKDRWSRMFATMKDLKEGEELGFDLAFTRHKGVNFNAKLNCVKMNNEDGQSMLRITLEDITTIKQSEAELRIAATAFESQDGLMITDVEHRVLKINQAFAHISGYSNDEVVGKNARIFGSGRHDAAFFAAMYESVNKTGRWSGEVWNRRKNGELYPVMLTVTPVKADNGIILNYVGTVTDVTQIKAAEKEIQRLAFYDPLTNLPNRRLLLDRLNHALASSARSGRQGALMFLDLDQFKTLNDSRGHDAGDLLLQQVTERLISCVREGDTVARLGGDEFVVVIEDLSEQDIDAAAQAEIVANKILATINLPYQLAKYKHHNTTSIGVTLFKGHQSEVEDLLKQADIAMYQAKKAGRNTLRFFNPQMQANISARTDLELDLRKALEGQQFHLYYQVQVDHLGQPMGAEALIRWLHPERGLVSPLHFIPLLEETGLILPIGQWVLETACAQLKAWQQNALTRNLTLSINVSAKQFYQAEFVPQVQTAVQGHGIDPMQLKLELTESILLEDIEDTKVTMSALQAIGVQLSLDDFGTGYSSLKYLKLLPLYQLKIDQSFVRDIVTDSSDRSIVRTIIAMAQSLYLGVIAEGVETAEQRDILLSNGCKRYQGFLFGKPVPIDQFEAALKQG